DRVPVGGRRAGRLAGAAARRRLPAGARRVAGAREPAGADRVDSAESVNAEPRERGSANAKRGTRNSNGRLFATTTLAPLFRVPPSAFRVWGFVIRIIAGEFKGRLLKTPVGDKTRPTADRVREAWLSILQHPVRGARALDLYAGSGALGLEALSR